ncbi:Histone methylation protein DOT1 [Phytophthora infestans]|uniref:Histone methylation protein DOT1 n=1 Tax=Phytophthora infestans TaxID=4787 RepID=A0A833W8I0_PHYIN|nr:Histone methylation protein DOT1 [Phytophthora infestans]KAF4146096.1 Histone methylation protein DOT1 [Phytophthora infestans]
MVRPSFTFDDDKELVQIVRCYEGACRRVPWRDVALRMRQTGHAPASLQQRLRSLKRMHGTTLADFPPNCFTPVERPRGRPSAVMRRLRALAVAPHLPRSSSRRALNPLRGETLSPNIEISELHPSPPFVDQPLSPRTLISTQTPSLSSSSTEEALAEIFGDVPRELVLAYDGHSTHKNVGEVLPARVSMLLDEMEDINDRDIFVDIGSGLGNVVAQVVLSTNVYRAVGIEPQQHGQTAGIQAINQSLFAWAFRDRAPFICKDVRDMRLGSMSPFAEVTIVYWNNISASC